MSISKKSLLDIKQDIDKVYSSIKKRIVICAGAGCVASGSLNVYDEFLKVLKDKNLDITVALKKEDEGKDASVVKSGCQGLCQMGVLVTVLPEEILYIKVTVSDVAEIIEKSIQKDEIIDRLLYLNPETKKTCKGINEIPFYTNQHRLLLKICGSIDANSINEYIQHDGYLMAEKAVSSLSSQDICKEISDSGLRGRGGGGFLTGLKWTLTEKEKSDKKYVICNADEGDPGAFMDRSIMDGNPHAVIEGMIIAAQAIGSDEGYIYVRTEYASAVKCMNKAIAVAEDMGILGNNIFGSGKKFTIRVVEGAGAFVCGEETALIASIEGERGMPKPKPPFPAQKGLWGKPTVINNVETLANIPLILKMGASEFGKIGTEDSKGTKTFALTGNIANTGLIEVPFGTKLGVIIKDIGGGVTDNNGNVNNDLFKGVQTGGPSGGCLTGKFLDVEIDYANLAKADSIMGSGGMIVMNEFACMPSISRFFIEFTQDESCGKCTPCREGTKRMLEILTNITEGRGKIEDLDQLEKMAHIIKKTSLCGLGQSAPNPVLSTIKNFREEYEEHILKKKCRAGVCENLVTYTIEDNCVGCTACKKVCPVEAVTGDVKVKHEINQDLCVKCDMCYQTCKFDAITKS